MPRGPVRQMDGYDIKEATSDFLIRLQDSHVEDATCADPEACAFAQALKGTYEVPRAKIWRAWAYIVLPDETGKEVYFRYEIPQRTAQQIIQFDKTGKAEPGGYWLSAPTPGQTLEARRKRDKKYKADIKAGHRPKPPGRKKGKQAPPKELHGVRSGTGHIRFAPIPKEESHA